MEKIEYTDGKRSQYEIRQMFLNLIRKDKEAKAEAIKRRMLKEYATAILEAKTSAEIEAVSNDWRSYRRNY